MEVICLESQAFYQLVEEVYQRILEKSEHQEKWVSPEIAMGLLNIKSKTTLQKLRDEGRIRFTQPQKRVILYDRESISEYLETNAKNPF